MRLLITTDNKIFNTLEFSCFTIIIAILSCQIELIDIIRVSIAGVGIIIYYVLTQFQKTKQKPNQQTQEQVPVKLESDLHTLAVQTPSPAIVCNAELIMDDFMSITSYNEKMKTLLQELKYESPQNLLEDITVLNIDSVASNKLRKWKKQSFYALLEITRNRGSELNFQLLEHNHPKLKSYLIQCFYRNQFILQFIPVSERDSHIKKQYLSQILHQLFSTFSHEFGTLLNYLLALAQVALEQFPAETSFFSPIKSMGQIMHHFVQDMVDYSDILNKKFQLQFLFIDVKNLLEEVVSYYRKQIEEKGLTIEYELRMEDQAKLIDGKRCKQILSNLISNAQKFTISGGIKILVTESANFLTFSVQDTGFGMNDEAFNNLKEILQTEFKSEQKISENTAGFGLGCYLSHQIALKLSDLTVQGGGGLKYFRQEKGIKVQFKVKTQPFQIIYNSCETSSAKSGIFFYDKGYFDQRQSVIDFGVNMKKHNQDENTKHSKFKDASILSASFSPHKILDDYNELKDQNEIIDRLRQNTQKKIFVGQKSPTFANIPGQSIISSQTLKAPPIILIVDDEMINIISLSILLKQFNIECHKAFNGQQALEKVQQMKDRYDIIFMDINMPIMDGFSATEKILAHDSQNMIVACTAFTDVDTKTKCYCLGMKYFLNKPVTKIELQKLLNHLKLIIQ